MKLFIQSPLTLEALAEQVNEIALPDFGRELRDGLNLGGGEYFKFYQSQVQVLLVCNDADHAEVFLPERALFPFYCFVWKGADELLEKMAQAMSSNGISCELGDAT
jgi:hypothetical protein